MINETKEEKAHIYTATDASSIENRFIHRHNLAGSTHITKLQYTIHHTIYVTSK